MSDKLGSQKDNSTLGIFFQKIIIHIRFATEVVIAFAGSRKMKEKNFYQADRFAAYSREIAAW